MRHLWRLLLAAAGVGLAALALRGADLGTTARALARLPALGLAAFVGGTLLAQAGEGLRLLALAGAPLRRLPAFTLHRWAGHGVSFLTPGPQFGGEPVTAAALRRAGLSGAEAGAVVALERLLTVGVNAAVVAALVLLTLAAGTLGPSGLAPPLVFALGIAAAALGLLFLLRLRRGPGGKAPRGDSTHQAGRSLPRRLAGLLQGVATESRRIVRSHPGRFAAAAATLALTWAITLLEYALLLAWLGTPLSAGGVLAGVAAARLALYTPLPGGLGAWELGQIWVLGRLGVPDGTALAFIALLRGRDLAVALAGGTFALRLLVPLRQGRRAAEGPRDAAP